MRSLKHYTKKNYMSATDGNRTRIISLEGGTSVFDVNHLLKKFEKMRMTMKKVTKNKKYQAQMLSQLGG